MPFTPFHFGPGFLIKGLAPRKFSLTAFILSQILIDIETAANIYLSKPRLHTFFHTYLGSLLVGALSTLIAFMFYKIFYKSFYKNPTQDPPSLRVIAISSFIGVWSHVVLDSIMHLDMTPFAPVTDSNPMLELVSLLHLHLGCVLTGVVGLALMAFKSYRLAPFKN